jgi:hypothetical protein
MIPLVGDAWELEIVVGALFRILREVAAESDVDLPLALTSARGRA